jgi:drug/metabolite transporter (DMT)-like permease
MSKRWAYLMLVGPALFWSGNFVLGRAVAADIPPITLSFWRWMVALLIFFPLGIRGLIREWYLVRSQPLWVLGMGTLGVSCFNTFVYLGLQQTTATNALLINSFIPILIILLSGFVPGVPITIKKLSGILISTIGVLILIAKGQADNLLALSFNPGDLWVLMAAFCWAIYSIGLRWRPSGMTASSFLLIIMIVGVVLLWPFYGLNLMDEPPLRLSVSNILSIAYVALFASIAAFLLWNQGVRMVGPGAAGQFIHLMPVLGTLMAILFLGEQLYLFHVAGGLAIGLGIWLSLRDKADNA